MEGDIDRSVAYQVDPYLLQKSIGVEIKKGSQFPMDVFKDRVDTGPCMGGLNDSYPDLDLGKGR